MAIEVGSRWYRSVTGVINVLYSDDRQVEYRPLDGIYSLWMSCDDFIKAYTPLYESSPVDDEPEPADETFTFTIPDPPMSDEAKARYAGFSTVEQWRKAVG